MINLDTTTKSLEVVLAGAITTNQLVVTASYVEISQTTFAISAASENDTVTNNSTAVKAVDVPSGASITRKVSFLSVYNKDTVSATVTVQINNNGTIRILCKVPLATGETLLYGG